MKNNKGHGNGGCGEQHDAHTQRCPILTVRTYTLHGKRDVAEVDKVKKFKIGRLWVIYWLFRWASVILKSGRERQKRRF